MRVYFKKVCACDPKYLTPELTWAEIKIKHDFAVPSHFDFNIYCTECGTFCEMKPEVDEKEEKIE
jgi:hypothetical protein